MKKKFEYPIPVDPSQFSDTIKFWESLEVPRQNEVRAFWEKLVYSLPQQEESDPLL